MLSRAFGTVDISYLRKWLVLGLLIGVVAGIGSILFYVAIDWATRFLLGAGAGFVFPVPAEEGETLVATTMRPWAIPLITTAGGLVSGLLVFKFAPEAEGHGTDAAINIFHNKEGMVRRRVPIVKMIASAITIGSGGSAGRAGPIGLIGGGIGAAVADSFRLSPRDRRIALAVGMGAGIGSIFKVPLGGALISAEILYRRDFEFEALLPSLIASLTGYAVFASWHGWEPIFVTNTQFAFSRPEELLGYVVLGVVCGLVGMLYGRTFYKTRDLFKSLRVPAYIKPAIGGLGVGLIGMFLPQVLGMGYEWLQMGINGNTAVLPVGIMAAVIFGKIAATSLSIGSGGSGGVFAPGLVIGGMVGGVTWSLLHNFAGVVPSDPAAFVVLGMMTLFGGIAKAPLSIMIMVSEMTGNLSLLLPCMVSVVIAYFLTGKSYIHEHQVDTRADSPAHREEYSVTLLDRIKIGDAMSTDAPTVSPDMPVGELAGMMRSRKIDAAPVVQSGKLLGIVASKDLARVSEDRWERTPAREIMTAGLIVGYAEETLCEALERMTSHNISHLPVVEHRHPDRLVGFLAVHNIASTYDVAMRCVEGSREARLVSAALAGAPSPPDTVPSGVAEQDASKSLRPY